MSDYLPPLPISLEKFTELAHRTASRYSHRSELEKVAYTFLPHTLEDFHRQVCAAIEANTPAVLERDAIAVNLLRHAGLDKHKARECADLVLQMLAAPQPQPVAQPVQASDAAIHQHGFARANNYLQTINESLDKQLEEVMSERDERDDVLASIAHLIDAEFTSEYGIRELVADLEERLAATEVAQPVQAQPSDVDFEAKTCPEAFLQQEISKLKTSLATTVDALEMGLQIGDQCSRGFLAKFHKMASDAITNSQPKPANQQKD